MPFESVRSNVGWISHYDLATEAIEVALRREPFQAIADPRPSVQWWQIAKDWIHQSRRGSIFSTKETEARLLTCPRFTENVKFWRSDTGLLLKGIGRTCRPLPLRKQHVRRWYGRISAPHCQLGIVAGEGFDGATS